MTSVSQTHALRILTGITASSDTNLVDFLRRLIDYCTSLPYMCRTLCHYHDTSQQLVLAISDHYKSSGLVENLNLFFRDYVALSATLFYESLQHRGNFWETIKYLCHMNLYRL